MLINPARATWSCYGGRLTRRIETSFAAVLPSRLDARGHARFFAMLYIIKSDAPNFDYDVRVQQHHPGSPPATPSSNRMWIE